jgi:aryl-alcohol dehydrogenase-like predicted oxidoreductase
MAKIGFGTYRITDTNQAHIDTLKTAIKEGITLIDTATNYYDGGSERAIAKAFEHFDKDIKDSVEIVSKFGYIQGSLKEQYKDDSSQIAKICKNDTVKLSDNSFYHLSKEFMKNQLTQSLNRMELSQIDCYLIHNPENYIYDAINKNIQKEKYINDLYEKIYDVFVGFEEEIKNNRLKSYGISSNSFSKNEDEMDFLPYENLLQLAKKAAKEVNNDKHGFSTIELPINILEKQGLKCTFWAKEAGLRVITNRALNAVFNSKMYRLAEYEENKDYYMYLNELLEYCENDLLMPLYNLIGEMEDTKHKYDFIGDYDYFLHAKILPHIQKTIRNLEGSVKDNLISYLDSFLNAYRDMVAYEISKKTKKELSHIFKDSQESMQHYALKYLLKQDSIDYVLVGARRIRYLYELV